jgi:hypothetical protein
MKQTPDNKSDGPRILIWVNNASLNVASVADDVQKSLAINEISNKECWHCGYELTKTERVVVGFHYIGSKT